MSSEERTAEKSGPLLRRRRTFRWWPHGVRARIALACILVVGILTASVMLSLRHTHRVLVASEMARVTQDLGAIPGLVLQPNTWRIRIGPYKGGNGNETACGIAVSVQVEADLLTPTLIERIHQLPAAYDIENTARARVYRIKANHPVHERFDWIDRSCVGGNFVDS